MQPLNQSACGCNPLTRVTSLSLKHSPSDEIISMIFKKKQFIVFVIIAGDAEHDTALTFDGLLALCGGDAG